MKKRLSALALLAGTAGLFLQPAAALARDRDDYRDGYYDSRDRHREREWREHERHERREREWRERYYRYNRPNYNNGYYNNGYYNNGYSNNGYYNQPSANGYYDSYGVWHPYGY